MLNRSFVVISLLAFIGLVACKSPPATDSAQLAAGSVVLACGGRLQRSLQGPGWQQCGNGYDQGR